MKYEKKYFDDQFSNYSDVFGNGWGMNWRAYMKLRAKAPKELLCEIINKKDNCSVLEIGCATGDFTETYIDYLCDKQGDVVGCDISELAINICSEKFEHYKNASFKTMELPYIADDRSYDCIVCMDVLEYFDHMGKIECVDSMKRHLKDSGVLLVMIPLGNEEEEEIKNIFSDRFSEIEVAYVYGWLWFHLFEKKLVLLVNTLYRHNKLGVVGKIVGKIAYYVCKSEFIVNSFFHINRRVLPQKKSHLIITSYI